LFARNDRRTGAIAEIERVGHSVADGDSVNVLANCDDGTNGFVAEDQSGRWHDADPVPVTLPGVPVRSADATGLGFDDDSRWFALWPVDLLYFHSLFRSLKNDRFHGVRC
jgi:hypothetical protein